MRNNKKKKGAMKEKKIEGRDIPKRRKKRGGGILGQKKLEWKQNRKEEKLKNI